MVDDNAAWEEQLRRLGDPPILMGPWGLVEGYYRLELHERDAALFSMEGHTQHVSAWYNLLSLHVRAFAGGFKFEGAEEGDLLASRLRMELLALGLITSKTTLDTLLRATYSPAYAGARHMIETWCLSRYVEKWPRTARLYYAPPPGETHTGDVPPVKNMITRLKQHSSDPRELAFLDRAQAAWEYFCKGSHPTDIGIVQTHGSSAGKGILGSAFHPGLWEDGIRNGLISAFLLVHETGRLQKQSQQWEDEVTELAVFILQLTSPDAYQALIDTTRDTGS